MNVQTGCTGFKHSSNTDDENMNVFTVDNESCK